MVQDSQTALIFSELVSLTSRSGNLGNWNLIVLPILSKIHHNVGSHARSASDSNGFV
jgi:hypothetical protein